MTGKMEEREGAGHSRGRMERGRRRRRVEGGGKTEREEGRRRGRRKRTVYGGRRMESEKGEDVVEGEEDGEGRKEKEKDEDSWGREGGIQTTHLCLSQKLKLCSPHNVHNYTYIVHNGDGCLLYREFQNGILLTPNLVSFPARQNGRLYPLMKAGWE